MARWADLDVLDDGLDSLKAAVEAAGGAMLVCSGASAPADRAAALAAALATKTTPTVTITGAAGSARTATVSAATGNAITASGDATHIALIDGSKLWFVTTCTTQTLTSGGTVDIPEWTIVVNQPVAP
jgi:uncharacterized metal-binding protein